MRTAIISEPTRIIEPSGHGGTLAPGSYEVAELDGHRIEDGRLFLYRDAQRNLVQADPRDPMIRVVGAE